MDLEPRLEEQQHDPAVREDRELVAVRDIAGREGRHEDADEEVADHGGEAHRARGFARQRGRQQQKAELQDGGCGVVHCRENRGTPPHPWGGGAEGAGGAWRETLLPIYGEVAPKAPEGLALTDASD